jgi:hypothetical protein
MAVGERVLDFENAIQQRSCLDNLSMYGGQVAELDGLELSGSVLSCIIL